MIENKYAIFDILLFSGLTVMVILLSAIIPLASMLMPLPIILLTLRRGNKASLLAIFLIALPILFFVDAQIFLAIILIAGLVGNVAGNAFLEGFTSKKTLIIILLVALAGQAIYLGVSHYLLASNVFIALEELLNEAASGQIEPELLGMFTAVINGSKKIFPSFIFMSGILTALLNYYGTYFFASKLKLPLKASLPFSQWTIHKNWSVLFVFVFAIYVLLRKTLVLNLLLILALIFVLIGLSVIDHKFKDRIKANHKKIFFWILLAGVLLPPLGALIIGLLLLIGGPLAFFTGILDGWLNLRKIE